MKHRLVLSAATSFCLAVLVPQTAFAQNSEIVGPKVIEGVFLGESAPLTELAVAFAAAPAAFVALPDSEIPNEELDLRSMKHRGPALPALQQVLPADLARQFDHGLAGTTPEPMLSFEGTSDDDNAAVLGSRVVPPDTEGDVGYKYYAQMNNLVFEIFSKQDGSSVVGPLPNNIFFNGAGGVCDTFNDGDPIVLYDHEAQRWVFSQFAVFEFVPALGQFVSHQCFAVSKTKDALGAYYLYDFVTATPQFRPGAFAALNDYPKLGIWPDGIYYTANDFEYNPGGQFSNVSAIAFDKASMYAGGTAIGIQFKIGPLFATDEIFISLLPSHWEGRTKPKKGAPNTFWQMFDSEQFTFSGSTGPDGLLHWDFFADFQNPLQSKFVARGLVELPEYESFVCSGSGRNCVDQPSPGTIAEGNGLDTIDFRLMFRSQYRRFGDDDDDDGSNDDGSEDNSYESVVVSATVDADGDSTNGTAEAGIRWAELRKRGGGGWQLHQAGTFAPADAEQRFMPSIAQNKRGEIALGYTVSSDFTYPSVRYTMRQVDDPLGVMTGGEVSCFDGSGSQISSFNRWGDYATMSVDPKNDCTFWYTNEYYEEDARFDFKTRICSFNRCDDDADDDDDASDD